MFSDIIIRSSMDGEEGEIARARWKKGGKLAISGANKIKNALKKQKKQVKKISSRHVATLN